MQKLIASWKFLKRWGREIGLFALALVGLGALMAARARKKQLAEIREEKNVAEARTLVARAAAERAVVTSALGADHMAAKRMDARLAENKVALSKALETHKLTPAEVEAEFKRLGY